MLTFQQIILTLNQYWDARGCALLQPYDMEVGAGTFHTATFLRSIGPEPWNAAYVQPSRRPKDGRYGENPNRLQHYYQYQVVMKPSPADLQELYLGSLYALGIDPTVNPGYDSLTYTVTIKGDGTPEQFQKIHRMVQATSPNFANISRAVALNPTLVVE